jgi:hypothetical protein
MFNWFFNLLTFISPKLALNVWYSKMNKMHTNLGRHLHSISSNEVVTRAWLLTHKDSPRFNKIFKTNAALNTIIKIIKVQLKMLEQEMKRIKIQLTIAELNLSDKEYDLDVVLQEIGVSYQACINQLSQTDKLRLRQEAHRIAQESWEEAVALSNQTEVELSRATREMRNETKNT